MLEKVPMGKESHFCLAEISDFTSAVEVNKASARVGGKNRLAFPKNRLQEY